MGVDSNMMTAAIIGGGVIGGGWAARFLLNGWDVRVFDPDPDAEAKLAPVLAQARRALPSLTDVALPQEGTLTFYADMAEAVSRVAWIQESVPERLDIKHKVLASVQAHCPPDAIIGSSTSGFKPSELQEGAVRPDQIMVCHPFNPVYLMPLIEVVPSPLTDTALVEKAEGILRDLGHYPLRVRRKLTPISRIVSLRRCGARPCGWSRTVSPPPRKLTRRSAWGSAFVGRRWDCLIPIARRVVTLACVISWRSLAPVCSSHGPS
jgi:3-hydroxyacyl-CoA dehydrogenase